MTAKLGYLGLTHAGAPLVIRERVRPTREQCRAMLDRLGLLADGRLILCTCERFEVYSSGADLAANRWFGVLADWFHLPRRLVARYAVCRRGFEVAEHLMRVAAGLDSRVLGEPQVLGQLREAQRAALEAKALDATLAALTRSAIRAGRRVRHETPINQGRRSIALLAVEELMGERDRAIPYRAIVLGSGHLARDVVASYRTLGVGDLRVTARNAEAGRSLAERFGGTFVPLSGLSRALAEADGLIACTSASSYLVDASTIGAHRSTPLTVLDLCVPRNVDPDVARLPPVRLVHLDDLLSRHGPAIRGWAPAIDIVDQELHEFRTWLRERAAAPRIAALIRQARSGGGTLSPEAKRALHERIMRLKRGLAREEVAA